MNFREVTAADVPEVLRLETLCFEEAWDRENVRGELELNPFSHGWLLEQGGRVLAYAFLWETFEVGQLARIGVDPDFRKQGLAKKMMEFLLGRAAAAGCELVRLEVRPSNVAGLALYRGLGFEQTGSIKDYYSNHEDALVMVKMLERIDECGL